jgi:hypothetical protein
MKQRHSAIFAIAFSGIAVSGLSAMAQSSQDTFNQNMQNADQVYRYQQQQQQQQQMQQYQNNAGNFNPGPLDRSVGNNTYVSPSYHNGAAGVTVTRTTK